MYGLNKTISFLNILHCWKKKINLTTNWFNPVRQIRLGNFALQNFFSVFSIRFCPHFVRPSVDASTLQRVDRFCVFVYGSIDSLWSQNLWFFLGLALVPRWGLKSKFLSFLLETISDVDYTVKMSPQIFEILNITKFGSKLKFTE